MKKRGFLNLCVVAALTTITAGSLYSCKDYDDEIFAELENVEQNAEQNAGSLQQQINDQKAALEKAKQDMEDKLAAAKAEHGNLRIEFDEKLKNYATKEDLENLKKEELAELNALKERLSTAETRIATLEKAVKELQGCCAKLKEIEEKLADKADKKDVENLLTEITNLNQKVQTMDASLNALDVRVTALEEAAKNHVTTEQLQKVIEDVAKVQGEVIANKAWAENEIKNLDAMKADKSDVEKLQKDLEKLQKDVDAKDAALKEVLQKEIKTVADSVNIKLDSLNTKFTNILDLKVTEIQTKFEDADKKLQKQIDTLKSDVNVLKNEVKKISVLQTQLNQMITSVLVNGAKSPVVGYFSLPTGMKSNILAAYYGSAKTNDPLGINFPSYELAQIVGGAKDNSAIKLGNDQIILAEGYNAGKVYVTVNPSSVDMTGKEFSLVNSLGEVAPMTFGKAVPSTDKLTFGYTRAANKNFYEIPASLSEEQIANAKVRVEISELKQAVKQVKDAIVNKSGLDVTNLASTIFACINDIADANAVKVSWTANDVNGNVVHHDVMSDFGLAAVAVKPLSYEFMKDYEIKNFWGIDHAYNLLDKVVAEAKDFSKKLAGQFPQFEIEQPRIDTITLEELDEDFLAQFELTSTLDTTFTVSVNLPSEKDAYISADRSQIIVPDQVIEVKNDEGEVVGSVTVPGRTYNVEGKEVKKNDDNSFTVTDTFNIYYTYEVDLKDAVQDLYDKMGEAIGDANEIVKEIKRFFNEDVQDLLDQVNGMGSNFEENLNDAIDKVNSKLTGLIGKVNNGLCKIVNNVNETLQPVMFAQGMGDFVMVSRAANVPSVYPASFVLVPSSFTGEYLAPAAHKFIAVTNVMKGDKSAQNGDAQCKKVLENTNTNNANLQRVLPGENHAVAVENLASGYVYEFTYSAIDFYGKVRNTKCYVTVE